jgi:hypothetical protein
MMKPTQLWISFAVVFGTFAGWVQADEDKVNEDLIRKIELHWEKQTAARSYELELGFDSQFGSTLYSEKLIDIKFAVDLLPGAYFYRVRAIDEFDRPGRWTAVQELYINARPPKLISPPDKQLIQGNLQDTGLPMLWQSSGPGIRYLIEIKYADQFGNYKDTIVKQEVEGTEYPFFPQEIGKYQWAVHTLGPAGDESGSPWEFEIEGVVPRGSPPDTKRLVRYVSPWWRNHWTLYTRYGQALMRYTIIDQDLRASSAFTGLTGYLSETLNWEWHDPVKAFAGGIPWIEGEVEIDRLTVLSESVVLPRYTGRFGAWFDEWAVGWRFSPVFEFGSREIAIYQPRSSVEAARSTTTRTVIGFGPAAEYKMKPFLILNASFKINYQFGGLAGLRTINGDQFNINDRAGNMKPGIGFEGILGATMVLGPRLKVQGRFRYESSSHSWAPTLPLDANSPGGDTRFSISNFTFDIGLGVKF